MASVPHHCHPEGGRAERELESPLPTAPLPMDRVQSPLGRGRGWAHETALSAPSLYGRSMGCLEEHKRLLCVTLLISEATEICYR